MIPENENTEGQNKAGGTYEELYKKLFSVISDIGEDKVVSSGVLSASTLWRWKTNTNQKSPNASKVLALLELGSKTKSMALIASKYGEVVKEFLKKSFPVAYEESIKREIDTNTGYLKDEYDFLIYYMCCNERGATFEEVVYTIGKIAANKANIGEDQLTDELIIGMGSFAKPKVERLIAVSVIQEAGKFLICPNTNTYIEEKQGLKQSINMLNNIVNSDGWNTGKSVFYLSSDAVEEDIAKKASTMLKNTFLEVQEMLESNKSNSVTARPFVFCVAAESLIAEKGLNSKELH